MAVRWGNMTKTKFKEILREKIKQDRIRVRKDTLREILNEVSILMDRQSVNRDTWDEGYEAALREVYVEIAIRIGGTV